MLEGIIWLYLFWLNFEYFVFLPFDNLNLLSGDPRSIGIHFKNNVIILSGLLLWFWYPSAQWRNSDTTMYMWVIHSRGVLSGIQRTLKTILGYSGRATDQIRMILYTPSNRHASIKSKVRGPRDSYQDCVLISLWLYMEEPPANSHLRKQFMLHKPLALSYKVPLTWPRCIYISPLRFGCTERHVQDEKSWFADEHPKSWWFLRILHAICYLIFPV